jgi:hypothetical protein
MQQLHKTLTTHKAQHWQEALSQVQQDKTIIRPWEEALSQHSPVAVALVILVTTPTGATDMKSSPQLYHLNG